MAVNKVVYGDETLVDLTNDSVTPDTLAEGATAHDASGARITGTMKSGGGVSVQSDWNQTDETAADFIKNKPFGDFLTGGDSITFDSSREDYEVNEAIGGYKISDSVITEEDLQNGALIVLTAMGMTAEQQPNIDYAPGELAFLCDLGMFLSVTEGDDELSAGIYFVPVPGTEGLSLTATLKVYGYAGFPTLEKIDAKFLPEKTTTDFYWKNDDSEPCYLYTDNTYTDKVTLESLGNAVNDNNLVLHRVTYDAPWRIEHIVYAELQNYSGTNTYGYLVIIESMGENGPVYRKIYTAEYTG